MIPQPAAKRGRPRINAAKAMSQHERYIRAHRLLIERGGARISFWLQPAAAEVINELLRAGHASTQSEAINQAILIASRKMCRDPAWSEATTGKRTVDEPDKQV